MGRYDVAQICLNGHVANSMAQRQSFKNKAYCEDCGEKTIVACTSCNEPIRGEYYSHNVIIDRGYTPPHYCLSCGQAFPWTTRTMRAAIELAAECDDFDESEQKLFTDSLAEATRDTPAATVAGVRIGKLLRKLGNKFQEAFERILVDTVSETAKKMIWPDR